MAYIMKKASLVSLLALLLLGVNSTRGGVQSGVVHSPQDSTTQRAKVTFIELGSVRCIPCRAMQPVMRAIEGRYGDQINVVFYDVWTPKQNHYARDYGIRVIPTQIFLDSTATEILRHEGFFPEKEIIEFLDSKGLEPVTSD